MSVSEVANALAQGLQIDDIPQLPAEILQMIAEASVETYSIRIKPVPGFMHDPPLWADHHIDWQRYRVFCEPASVHLISVSRLFKTAIESIYRRRFNGHIVLKGRLGSRFPTILNHRGFGWVMSEIRSITVELDPLPVWNQGSSWGRINTMLYPKLEMIKIIGHVFEQLSGQSFRKMTAAYELVQGGGHDYKTNEFFNVMVSRLIDLQPHRQGRPYPSILWKFIDANTTADGHECLEFSYAKPCELKALARYHDLKLGWKVRSQVSYISDASEEVGTSEWGDFGSYVDGLHHGQISGYVR